MPSPPPPPPPLATGVVNNVSEESYALRRGVLHGAAADLAVEIDYSQMAYVGGRGGSAARATPLSSEVSTADMSFGMLLMLLAITTSFAAGCYHLVRCISWLCQPQRAKLSRSPESSNEAEREVRSPYEITVERTSLLGSDD